MHENNLTRPRGGPRFTAVDNITVAVVSYPVSGIVEWGEDMDNPALDRGTLFFVHWNGLDETFATLADLLNTHWGHLPAQDTP